MRAIMTIGIIVPLAALAVSLSGCASIVKGSSETVAISTVPVSGAVCTLSNPRGQWRVRTPGRVKVKRSSHDMDVTCKALGYTDATGTISSDFQTWTLGNLLIGGVVGLIVDWSTGGDPRLRTPLRDPDVSFPRLYHAWHAHPLVGADQLGMQVPPGRWVNSVLRPWI